MVKHSVFGVERDIDIPANEFPTESELEAMEAPLTAAGCQHEWFESTHDNLQLHIRKYLPSDDKKNPKAIVIFMHGLQSHCGMAYVMSNGRLVNNALLADHYTKLGFAVYAFDLVGHGYSEGARHVMPSTTVLEQDLVEFAKLITSRYPTGTPWFLTGESLGGNITLQAARYFQDHPEEFPSGFQGIVLFSPAIYPDTMYAPAQWYLQLCVTPFIPNWRPPACIPNPVGPSKVWRDPERVAKGLEHNPISAHCKHPPYLSLWTLTVAMRVVRDQSIPGLTLPFCVVHGVKDSAIPVVGSEYLVDRASTPESDKAHKFYEEAFHDLLAEPEAEEVVTFTSDWMNQRLSQAN
ncbi:Monoglyceride lipase [Seminavis robusta]|uniref:Monoglyceride lipase n=1 Tax=Seminavis robusta TaxID=568900 RepID=A0A9N8ED68_9STRA|nr:Monoglyceride lipase [Seminavis robusta]|eukprot:Sro821_g207380.1 Monoglyceride lipase (350) ;mRNA; r:27774-28823